MDDPDRDLFLRRDHLLHFGQRCGFTRNGKHAPIRVLRSRTNRAGVSAIFASITNPAAVGAFLDARCYKSWMHDNSIRDTGPFVSGSHLGLSFNLDFGVHPAVRIYYSPQVAAWMRSGRVGEIPEPAMIVKEMFYPPPAQLYQSLSPLAQD